MHDIGIIIPVYQVEQYVCRCLSSVVTQIFSAFFGILVDDGSYDTSPHSLDELALLDERFISIHKENNGLSSSRNIGIDCLFLLSEIKWITFIDSDDWIHHDYLKELMTVISENNADIGVCKMQSVDSFFEDHIYKDKEVSCFFHKNGGMMGAESEKIEAFACGRIYKLNLFENVRFPIGKYYEDLYIIPQILYNANKTVLVDLPLYYYYQGNTNAITKNFSLQKDQDYVDAIQNNLDYFRIHNDKIYQLFYKRRIFDCAVAINNTKNNAEKKKLRNKCRKLLSENKHNICLLDYDYAYALCSAFRCGWFFKVLVKLKIIEYK